MVGTGHDHIRFDAIASLTCVAVFAFLQCTINILLMQNTRQPGTGTGTVGPACNNTLSRVRPYGRAHLRAAGIVSSACSSSRTVCLYCCSSAAGSSGGAACTFSSFAGRAPGWSMLMSPSVPWTPPASAKTSRRLTNKMQHTFSSELITTYEKWDCQEQHGQQACSKPFHSVVVRRSMHTQSEQVLQVNVTKFST